ncbi:O-antigen ligase family protein [Streptomyces cellostaticus]|uniref:O-antigen ligase family protein n=1 Tax=Streptomyces cellostaticus TaxID=67285 RepID=UPI00099EBC4A
MSAALAPAPPLAPSLPALRRAAPVLPVVALIALIGLPKVGDGRATPADAACGLLVLWAVVHTARLARRSLTRAAAVVLGLPVIGLAVAATVTPDSGDGIVGLVRDIQVFVLVPVAVLLLLRDRRDMRLVAWSVTGLAVWEGGIGVHQYLTGTGAAYDGEFVRAVGTFGPTEVMGMATVVASGVVAATGLALGSSSQRQRIVAAVCALVLLVPLVMSFSRGAWIATVAACGAQLLLAGVRRAVMVFLAAAAAGVVLVGGLGVGTALLQERLGSITQVADAPDQSVLDRYALWSAAVGMWRDQPLTGVGLKAFPEYRDSHAPLSLQSASDTDGAGHGFYREPFLSPHNMYLEVLSEQGLLGLVTVAGSWLALLVGGLGRLLRTRTAQHGQDCALVGCGLLLWQLMDFVYSDVGGGSAALVALDFGLAAWWALARDAAPATTVPPEESPR